MEVDLEERFAEGITLGVPRVEAELQMKIVSELDLTCLRGEKAIPEEEASNISNLIEELNRIRQSKERLPISPGLQIWLGELAIRKRQFDDAVQCFATAQRVLEELPEEQAVIAETLVTALTEGAYANVMNGCFLEARDLTIKAIRLSRQHEKEESDWQRILRENFVAGQSVTKPLAAAYLMACDIRINSGSLWDEDAQVASDMDYYWRRLNTELKGLSAVQVPHLMAVLSDQNWIERRSDLAAPLARALYLKTSDGVPQALWRRANLIFGGFRLNHKLAGVAKADIPRAAGFVLACLIANYLVQNGPETLDGFNNFVATLGPEQVSERMSSDLGVSAPSGNELLEAAGINASTPINQQMLQGMLIDGVPIDNATQAIQVASGGSSGVKSTLV